MNMLAVLAGLDPGETPRALVIHANVVTFILTLLIPVATALLTRSTAVSWKKAVTTIVLGGAVTLLTVNQLPDGTALLTLQTMFDWLMTTAIAVVTYLGLWKPVLAVNQRIAPDFGIA